jgi:hypothetical protein
LLRCSLCLSCGIFWGFKFFLSINIYFQSIKHIEICLFILSQCTISGLKFSFCLTVQYQVLNLFITTISGFKFIYLSVNHFFWLQYQVLNLFISHSFCGTVQYQVLDIFICHCLMYLSVYKYIRQWQINTADNDR